MQPEVGESNTEPAGHVLASVHNTALVVREKKFGGHDLQTLFAVVVQGENAYWPGLHLVHGMGSDMEVLGQWKFSGHGSIVLTIRQKNPLGHTPGAEEPSGQYAPSSHGVSISPAGQKYPARHLRWADDPAGQYIPLLQGVGAVDPGAQK